MARKRAQPLKQMDRSVLLDRLESILVNAAEGQRSVGDDRQYSGFRRELLRRKGGIPNLVLTNPSVDSFYAFIRKIADRPQRVDHVRKDFALINGDPERTGPDVDSRTWTGIAPPTEQAIKVIRLMPLAQAAVESLIAQLAEPNVNGAPLLDDRVEAIQYLRQLHDTLGDLLNAAENGELDDSLGKGLVAEAVRYSKRAARALRNDPMPYVASGLLLGLLDGCGFPGVAGFISGIALNIRKHGGPL
jgi:hypothetical protein